ncbi:MAG: efflux RND transporter periplasmic adaptor subunit [Pseudomonadota bacterium]
MNTSRFCSIGIVLISALIGACGGSVEVDDKAPNALLVTPYDVIAASEYDAESRFSGQVQAARESALGFEMGGELASVLVDEGDTVAAGAPLARLDRSRLRTAVADAEAALAQSAAQQELAQATFTRLENARDFDGVSTQELEQAAEQLQRADSALSSAQARLQRVRLDFSKATLTAPFAGMVVARMADEGRIIGAGQPILELQEAAALEVRLSVSGTAIDSMTVGSVVSLNIDGRDVPAKVKAVIGRRNLRTRAIEVILALDDGAAARVGDIAELTFLRTVSAPGYWVPISALTEGARGVWNVLAIEAADDRLTGEQQRETGATHVLENRPVELLHETESRVYVRGALGEGDRIVADGLQRVVRGQGVRVDNVAAYAADSE